MREFFSYTIFYCLFCEDCATNDPIVLWTVRSGSDAIRTALFTLKVKLIFRGKHRRLWPLNTVNPILISYAWAFLHGKLWSWNIAFFSRWISSKYGHVACRAHSCYVRKQSGQSRQSSFVFYCYTHSLTHSITQRDGIVASPPVECSIHKNICYG